MMDNPTSKPHCLVDIVLDDVFAVGATQFKYRHAAHCFIWAPWNSQVFEKYETKAAILMQLRFDGTFGFPGGLIDEEVKAPQDIVDGLNRELVEELNLNMDKYKVTGDNYMFTHKEESTKNLYHFYSLKVTLDDIKEIERGALSSVDYGHETFGLLRVPLYVMDDGVKGFPSFLENKFIGNAKSQLLNAIKHNNILTDDELLYVTSKTG